MENLGTILGIGLALLMVVTIAMVMKYSSKMRTCKYDLKKLQTLLKNEKNVAMNYLKRNSALEAIHKEESSTIAKQIDTINEYMDVLLQKEEQINMLKSLLESDLVAWDENRVYKTFEYGKAKKGEVVAQKDKKSYRKPVKIGVLKDNKFIALDSLVNEVYLLKATEGDQIEPDLTNS